MRFLLRLFIAAACLLIAVALFGVGGIVFLTETEMGNRLMRERTQATITRLLGPAYVSDLGEQTFEIRPDGTLAVGWNGVTLSRTDRPEAPTAIDRVAFAVRLMPLVRGGLQLGRLEIDGAAIDLGAFLTGQAPPRPPAERRSIALIADGAVAALERQLSVLGALSFEAVAFTDITLNGLPPMPGDTDRVHVDFAELRRDGEGTLDLAAGLSLGPLPLSLSGNADFDETGRLDDVSLRSSPAELGLLFPPAPIEERFDERPFGTNAALAVTVRVDRDAQSDRLVSDFFVTSGPGDVQAGRNRTRIEEMQLKLRHREGEERIEIVESPMRFRGTSFAVQGHLEPTMAGSGLVFDVAAPEIRSVVGMRDGGAGEPQRGSLVARGMFDPFARTASIERFEFAAGTARLAGEGSLDFSRPDASTRLRASGSDIAAPTAKAFWPFNLSGRARRWVVENLGDDGRVPTFDVRLDITRERMREAFARQGGARARELRVDLDFENADVATFGDLPRLYRANGHVQVRGSRTRVVAEDAMVVGMPAVAIGRSVVAFSKPRNGVLRDTLISFDIDAAGAADELLTIADRHPIRGLRSLDFAPADVSGTGQVRATAKLRIGDHIPPARILLDWSLASELIDTTIDEPVEGRQFSNLSGSLRVVPSAAEASLSGLMDDIPAEIELAMPVGPTPSVERLVEIDLDVSEEKAVEIVPALSGVLDGSIAAQLTQGPSGLHASLDLTAARLAIPAVAWTKGGGVAASVDADIVREGERTELRSIAFRGDGFSASGTATLDAGGLRSARLTDIGLNPGDSVALSMDRSPNGFSMAIEGEQFDARPLLQELKASAGQGRPESGSGQTFDIAASIDRVRGFDERIVGGLQLNYASHNGKLAALSLVGSAGQGEVRADLSPRSEAQAIRISAQDLGALVGFAGLYGNMEGGSARLELIGTPDGAYQGRVDVENFTLVDEPRLERFVGSEPVAGQGSLSQVVGRDLRTSRADFDQASAELYYGGGRLAVGRGILRGPIFGSSFEGTLYDRESRINISGSFMPAYSVNRIFGAIPLVGQILGNGNEGGLFGITYQLSGSFAAPTLTINPISIIAPGIFRQIFEY